MSIVVFVPGLRGQNDLTQDFQSQAGPNEVAIRSAAHKLGFSFEKLNYQSAKIQNPTLARMELRVLAQLKDTINAAEGKPIVAVGSSVGFGVLLGALTRLKSSTSPIGLIGFKPVPDPLRAIELQINNPKIVAAIKQGAIPAVPMPVESADGVKDQFMLSAKHLNDRNAHRILTNDFDATAFNIASETLQLQESTIIYGAADHLTPEEDMMTLRDSIHAVQADLIALEGNHATDFTSVLYNQTVQMARRLG